MPELPEVETVRRGLSALVIDKKVIGVDVIYPKIIVGDPSEFKEQVSGRTISAIDRRGKYLLFRFSADLTMVSHLRMEGKYSVKDAAVPLDKHTHVVFNFDDGTQLRYNDVRKFGRMQLVETGMEKMLPSLQKLGPEPTPETFDAQAFYQALHRRKKAVKTALLDQTLVVGLGNIYVDEVLWQTKIHPETKCANITEQQALVLHDNIILELERAIAAHGTTVFTFTDANSHSGSFQNQLNVYGKKGEPCPRCQTPIQKIVVGQRGTHFCPHCQQVI
ncbi:formamidopyrimidine-DNA glycosylase [Ligilactobacillus salitolerans]|uniref:Formamidopyrimidine-DNA glycosylase n=1 Tax=Ligilactobacillus salitolerans TaxID=1808352 RepID=A0A401IVS1_9LACO|nr:DNA-formamidopyrimidine glycosylase [Ligilactobacillus salitolerans]GBG95640.1 formamidopyrimidine-DNA glycosylase [Ligilactobacillus salitolerans]